MLLLFILSVKDCVYFRLKILYIRLWIIEIKFKSDLKSIFLYFFTHVLKPFIVSLHQCQTRSQTPRVSVVYLGIMRVLKHFRIKAPLVQHFSTVSRASNIISISIEINAVRNIKRTKYTHLSRLHFTLNSRRCGSHCLPSVDAHRVSSLRAYA